MNEVVTLDLKYLRENFKVAITELEQFLTTLPQQEIPVNHQFCDGLYLREGLAPAGTVVVTRVHKKDNAVFFSKGRCIVCSEGESKEIAAPMVFITKAGTKRLLYAVEDTVWTTVHPLPDGMGENTPIEVVEAYFACNTYEEHEVSQ